MLAVPAVSGMGAERLQVAWACSRPALPALWHLGPTIFLGLLVSYKPLARDVETVHLVIGRPGNQSEEPPRSLFAVVEPAQNVG